MLADNFARFFLFFSQGFFIISLSLLGLIWINRKFFLRLSHLVLISILINVALKITFKIPLSPLLGIEGFAFPSGHMQLSTVFYGCLAVNSTSKVFRWIIVSLLAAIGWALIHFGYHNSYDVSGALIVAGFLIFLQHTVVFKEDKTLYKGFLFFASLLGFYIYIEASFIAGHVFMAYYMLLGMIIAECSMGLDCPDLNFSLKLVATLASYLLLIANYLIFHPLKLVLPPYLFEMQWFLVGVSLPIMPLGVLFFHKFILKQQAKFFSS